MADIDEEEQGYEEFIGAGNQIFNNAGFQIYDVDSGSPSQEDDQFNSSPISSPLGLTLSKTPSLLNLLETMLSKNSSADVSTLANQVSGSHYTSHKLKASNFPIQSIKIGYWQKSTIYQGDLTAKLYYAKRKLVWEVLERPLKRKMEIQWSDIIAIRATIRPNEPGLLEIELNQPPTFGQEINPQPRKHTVWQTASDFTCGHAITWRRHYVSFAPGILDKHYEQLLQSDERLLDLSRKPFPSLEHACFPARQPHFNLNGNGSSRAMQPGLRFSYENSMPAPPRGPIIRLPQNSSILGMHYSNQNYIEATNQFMNQRNQQTVWNECQGINTAIGNNGLTQGHNQVLNPRVFLSNESLSRLDYLLEDTQVDRSMSSFLAMNINANPYNNPYNQSQMDYYQMVDNQMMQINQMTNSWQPVSSIPMETMVDNSIPPDLFDLPDNLDNQDFYFGPMYDQNMG